MKSKSETTISHKGKVIKHTIGTKIVARKKERKAVIKPSRGNQFRFVLYADGNTEPIAVSEQYKDKRSALLTLQKYFPDFKLVDRTF